MHYYLNTLSKANYTTQKSTKPNFNILASYSIEVIEVMSKRIQNFCSLSKSESALSLWTATDQTAVTIWNTAPAHTELQPSQGSLVGLGIFGFLSHGIKAIAGLFPPAMLWVPVYFHLGLPDNWIYFLVVKGLSFAFGN